MKTVAPYGTWRSPVSSDLLVADALVLDQIGLDGDAILWSEGRPTEGGRVTVMRREPDGATTELTPAPFNVRTRVHEYGGGAWTVREGTLIFSNFEDQRLHVRSPDGAIRPLTAEGPWRYADAAWDEARHRLICVREDHTPQDTEAINTLVAVDLTTGATETLVEGGDFYAAPRLSPDGAELAWLTWDHPRMPWDGTELRVARLREDGTPAASRLVAGGPEESVLEPQWSPAGDLHFVSDRTGWWNLYQRRGGETTAICPREAEFGASPWVFGLRSYGFEAGGTLLVTWIDAEGRHVGRLDPDAETLTSIETPFLNVHDLRVRRSFAVVHGGSPFSPRVFARLDLASGEVEILQRQSGVVLDEALISVAESITFPTAGGREAHAYYYPPRNPDFEAPEGEKPPLLVRSHGGPTSAVSSDFSLGVQYWTSRGFGFVAVNYGGSTGYGRAYRERLKGEWGIVDVDDCVAATEHLVREGRADGDRLTIDGGSAGGYTTLGALAFRDVFKAGASHFGLSDLTIFVDDTHKFESRYLDSLVGPWPERRDLYEARSPLFHVDDLSCPVIFFQGADDRVVPPNQAERMVDALRAKGLPVAYLLFEGEGHGFRRAENIRTSYDGQLTFFARVFGFTPADGYADLEIDNLPA